MKIALITDLHYSKIKNLSISARRSELGDILLLRLVQRLNRTIKPDLTIFLGDLIDKPDEPELLDDLAPIFAKLQSPYMIMPGNHDPLPEIFYRHIPKPPEYFDFENYRFIPFFDMETPGYNAIRSEADIKKLRTLSEDFKGRIISLQHVPLYSPGTVPCYYRLENAEEILKTPIFLSLAGHEHAGFPPTPLPGGGTAYAVPALCETPFHYTILEIDKDGELNFSIEQLRLPVDGLYDTHIHTRLAYCQENMEPERIFALKDAFGLKQMAFTEHSSHLYISAADLFAAPSDYWKGFQNGLGRMNIQCRMDEYFSLLAKCREIGTFISGLELDVTGEGSIFVEPDDLARVDLRVGAVHSLDEKENPAKMREEFLFRTEALLRNGKCHILAHPFRIFLWLGKESPCDIYPDVVHILKKYSCAAEINYHANNIPDPEFFALCHKNGVKIALGSDSHNLYEIGEFYDHLALLEKIGVSIDELYSPPFK